MRLLTWAFVGPLAGACCLTLLTSCESASTTTSGSSPTVKPRSYTPVATPRNMNVGPGLTESNSDEQIKAPGAPAAPAPNPTPAPAPAPAPTLGDPNDEMINIEKHIFAGETNVPAEMCEKTFSKYFSPTDQDNDESLDGWVIRLSYAFFQHKHDAYVDRLCNYWINLNKAHFAPDGLRLFQSSLVVAQTYGYTQRPKMAKTWVAKAMAILNKLPFDAKLQKYLEQHERELYMKNNPATDPDMTLAVPIAEYLGAKTKMDALPAINVQLDLAKSYAMLGQKEKCIALLGKIESAIVALIPTGTSEAVPMIRKVEHDYIAANQLMKARDFLDAVGEYGIKQGAAPSLYSTIAAAFLELNDKTDAAKAAELAQSAAK